MRSFNGVLLADLVAAQGIRGSTLHAVALNARAAELPLSDAEPRGPIGAYLLGGSVMSLREKGPF